MILMGMLDSPFVHRVAVTLNHYELPFTREVLSTFGDFDRMLTANAAHCVQLSGSSLILKQEFLCICTGLDFLQNFAHLILGLFGNDPRAARKITVFRIVRN